jgi:hypothetical protein
MDAVSSVKRRHCEGRRLVQIRYPNQHESAEVNLDNERGSKLRRPGVYAFTSVQDMDVL